jgi:hypothetical protein
MAAEEERVAREVPAGLEVQELKEEEVETERIVRVPREVRGTPAQAGMVVAAGKAESAGPEDKEDQVEQAQILR